MNIKNVISIENLSKAYSIYNKPIDILFELLTRKRRHDVFWALQDISFTVTEKQRLGIIGPNGAGKSTLLKIIAGNLSSTSGTVDVNGKISALLSLNSSLNPEETGLSNIRFNLILNGCPKSDIAKLTEEIIEFTELGPFVYSPVKTYSSGMLARLSFAICTSIEPEILVIDEVLSVGDAYFVNKAMNRMMELCDRGKALLFVSHSISAVQRLCDTALWLDRGVIREMGSADHITRLYEEDYIRRDSETTREKNIARKQFLDQLGSHSDLLSTDIIPLRLVADNCHKTFTDTHYVRKIQLKEGPSSVVDVNVIGDELSSNRDQAWLDLQNSEWGRIYDRRDTRCRLLYTHSGRNKGGRLFVRMAEAAYEPLELEVVCETTSIRSVEGLIMQYLDMEQGVWVDAKAGLKRQLESPWDQVSFRVPLKRVSEAMLEKAKQAIEEKTRPDVEIVDTAIIVEGKKTFTLMERQSFEVQVTIKANRLAPLVDVNLRIMRSDGVYIFWQSSGWDGNNIENLTGEAIVTYIFKENYLPGGEYFVTVGCASGWDLEKNYPHSELFDIRVKALQFTVIREYSELDFGMINMRVPVRVEMIAE